MSDKLASVIFMMLAVSLFAGLTLIAKAVGTRFEEASLHPVQITAGRYCFAALFLVPLILARRPGFQNIDWNLHITRVVAAWLGVTCLFIAATHIPLADANAISFMSVIVTMALSIPLLGERVGVKRWSAAIVALTGALILVRPGTDAFHPAALIALAGAVIIGFEFIIVKKLSGIDTPLRMLITNNVFGALVSLVVVWPFWTDPHPAQYAMLAAIGLIMLCAQFCFIQAMQRMDASFVTPFWYAAPVFAALYDFAIFNQGLRLTSLMGISLICIGGIVICRRS